MKKNYDFLIEILVEILEESIKKSGEKLLTNKELLNMLKLVRTKIEDEGIYFENFGSYWD